jgi:hypothetical protein
MVAVNIKAGKSWQNPLLEKLIMLWFPRDFST